MEKKKRFESPVPTEQPVYFNVYRELDHLKKIQQRLLHYVALIESSSHAIYTMSLSGIIITWNNGAEKLFGYTAKEAIGKHISLIIPKAYMPEYEALMER